jgi:metal-sulfur cluster biosynthetic enzyme
MPTVDQVMEALKNCYDPEIPVNIVDLGLVYDVKIIDDKNVYVKMTLTAPVAQ